MFSALPARAGGCLLVSFTIFLLSYSSVRFWLSGQSLITTDEYPKGLTAIFSTSTIDALNKDMRFQDALLSLTAVVAHSSAEMGKRFGWEELTSFGTNLTDGVDRLRGDQQHKKKRSGIVDDIGTTVQGLLGERIVAQNSSCGLTNIRGCLADIFTDTVGTPALFLGIGLGMGAATSLNLTDIKEVNAIANRVAISYNTSATGLNLAARQIGTGLSSELIPSFGDNTNFPLGQAAFALASGVGNATAVGLGLRQHNAEPSQGTSVVGIAGNLGLGVAMPIVSSMNLQATIRSWGNSSSGANMIKNLPLLAAAAGNGLGKGARNGFGLKEKKKSTPQKRQSAGPSKDTLKWARAVRLFTKGLSQSFIAGSNFSDLGPALKTAVSGSLDMPAMIGNIASGAGAGIGMGFAIGLDLKDRNSTPMISGDITNDELQTAAMAETFTQNLVSNLLLNSSVMKKVSQLVTDNPPQMIQSFDIAKAAEGLGRGAIEGMMIAMSSVGGLKYLIDGNFSGDAIDKVPTLPPTQFNDSISGGAVGLARGLSSKATILVADIARNLTNGTQIPKGAASMKRRSVQDENEGASVEELKSFSLRQEQPTNGNQIPLAIDPETVQISAQKVIDTLTCKGVGGIVSAALGFASTSPSDLKILQAAMGDSRVPLDSTVLQVLPKGPIQVTSEGNVYEVVLENRSIKINGKGLTLFVTLTGLHVAFTTLAFLIFLPIYVILGVAWRLSVIADYPIDEAKNKKWRKRFLISVAIFGNIGIIMGYVNTGIGRHFHDAHSILGLICHIFLIPMVGSSVRRLGSKMPYPSPRAFVGLKGPIELAKSPQRIYFISALFVQLVLMLSQSAFIQGPSKLRATFLCVVDAFFTSDISGQVMTALVMIQIAAMALVGIRAWLEQHIAKKEAGDMASSSKTNIFKRMRTDTIATFGFDNKDTPPAYMAATRGSGFSRKTDDLKGSEDHGISTPYNFRKEGSINEQDVRGMNPDERVDPFLSVEERINYQERGIYNPKTGGYSSYRTYGDRRPSSGVFDPQLSPRPPIMPTGPKTTNVSTKDLFPPPMPESERIRMTQKTYKTESSRYSRPIDGNVAVRDSYTGFGL